MPLAGLLLALLLGDAATTPAAADSPVLPGLLEARERRGCGSGDADTSLRTRFEGTQAIFEQDVWLSSRESLELLNAVDVTREGDTLSAEVVVHVEPIEEGLPVPACIRPVHVVLRIDGLPPGDYQLRLRKAGP